MVDSYLIFEVYEIVQLMCFQWLKVFLLKIYNTTVINNTPSSSNKAQICLSGSNLKDSYKNKM